MLPKIGFIGAGQMAKAIGISVARKGLVNPANISVACPDENLLKPWREAGCYTTPHNGEVIEQSGTVIWAVKPQIFPLALQGSVYGGNSSKFHVSIMAGITLDDFTQQITEQFPYSKTSGARVMPNIAMKVGCGTSVYTLHESATEENRRLLSSLLSSVGLTFEVPENQINAYCGLFGSGIGFMFPILESLSDGAVKLGIPRDISLKIAAQTMKGAAQLILEDNDHPGALKDSVCSPGGTTIAGIAKLEKFGIRNAIIEAVEAAAKKGDELGEATSSSPTVKKTGHFGKPESELEEEMDEEERRESIRTRIR